MNETVGSMSRTALTFHVLTLFPELFQAIEGAGVVGRAIEDGRLAHPIKNLRFTQGALDALSSVKAVGRGRTAVDAMLGSAYVPALLVDDIAFTGQTD